MDEKRETDASDVTPKPDGKPAADAMEQAQKEAAEQRSEGGGYGG